MPKQVYLTVGFNPLPPTVGGRSPSRARAIRRLVVSIRSRRLSAGEERFQLEGLLTQEFQSAPADCRREKGGRPAGGRATVSIRSRRLSAGEGSPAPDSLCLDISFNPLPPTVGGRSAAG